MEVLLGIVIMTFACIGLMTIVNSTVSVVNKHMKQRRCKKNLLMAAIKAVGEIEEIRLVVLRKHPDGTDHRPEHYEPRLTMCSVLRATEDLRKALGMHSGPNGLEEMYTGCGFKKV